MTSIDSGAPTAPEMVGASFCGLLQAQAETIPGETAVSWMSDRQLETVNWRNYRNRVLDVAAACLELGLDAGDVLATMASNRVEHLVVDLAALHCGAVGVALYNSLAADQLAHVLKDASPKVIVVEGVENLRRVATAARMLAPTPPIVFLPHPGESANEVEKDYWRQWDAFEARGRAVRPDYERAIAERIASVDPASAATLIYTSGTTGSPKGVVLTHRNLMWMVECMVRAAFFDFGYRCVSYLPLAHIVERLWSIYLPLKLGGHVMCCPDSSGLVESLRIQRPSYLMSVPRVWEKLQAGVEAFLEAGTTSGPELEEARRTLEAEWQLRQEGQLVPVALQMQACTAREGVLRDLRIAFGLDQILYASCAAAPLRLEVARFFASIGVLIHQAYGLTETAGPVIGFRIGYNFKGSIGTVLPGSEAMLADDGELLVRCPANTPGYRNLPAASADLFTADGWLKTGDIAHIDEAGLVYLKDRKKEIIVNSAGKNIAPTNVESRIAGRAFIAQAIAYGDERPYLVALLTVDHRKLVAYAAEHDIVGVDLHGLVSHPLVVAEAKRVVDEANSFLSRPEQVKRFRLIADEWTIERGEVTPTFKLRRKIIHMNNAEVIESLYA